MERLSRGKLVASLADPWGKLFTAAFVFPAVNLGLNHLVVLTEILLFLDRTFTAIAVLMGLPYGL